MKEKTKEEREIVYGADLGFLEPDLTFTKCSYGSHSVYAFKLLKKIKKEYEYLSRAQAFEKISEYAILTISRSCTFDEIAFNIPKNMNSNQFDWLCENYMEEMKICRDRVMMDFFCSGIDFSVIENSKLDKNHWLYLDLKNNLCEEY